MPGKSREFLTHPIMPLDETFKFSYIEDMKKVCSTICIHRNAEAQATLAAVAAVKKEAKTNKTLIKNILISSKIIDKHGRLTSYYAK